MSATSKLARSPRSVLLRMAADQERADRIRSLKQDNPQLKWRHIAEFVGVELRSAQMWQETGAISYENAKKLAELVDDPERDVEWIMRGPRTRTPSPFEAGDLEAKIDMLLANQQALTEAVAEIKTRLDGLPQFRDLEQSLESLTRAEEALNAQTKPARRVRAVTSKTSK